MQSVLFFAEDLKGSEAVLHGVREESNLYIQSKSTKKFLKFRASTFYQLKKKKKRIVYMYFL